MPLTETRFGKVIGIGSGTGTRPAAGQPGARFIDTSTTPVTESYDDGAAWHNFPSAGASSLSVSTKTTTYTITSSDDIVLADATGAGFSIALPTAVGWTKRITIMKIDSGTNAVTVGTTGGQTINGQSSRLLKAQFSAITLISDNANWRTADEALPLTTKGDLLVGLAANDMQRLGPGADGTVLTADSTQATGLKYATAGLSLNTVSAQLAADVTLTSAVTLYDGPSVSCAAGTWDLKATATLTASSNSEVALVLRDGSGTIIAVTMSFINAGQYASLSVAYPVTPGSTTTYKVSVECSTTGAVLKASTNSFWANTAGNNATSISGTQIA